MGVSEVYRYPFGGKPQKYTCRLSTGPNTTVYMKFGCWAQFKIMKNYDDDKIIIKYYGQRMDHQPKSLDSWHERRLLIVVRNWLIDVIANNNCWKSYRNLSRPNPETSEILESWGLTTAEPISISVMVRVRRSEFRNFHKRYIKILCYTMTAVGNVFRSMGSK